MFKKDFPIFENNPGLVYLDSGASAQKPRVVLEAMDYFYRHDYSNIRRSVHRLSVRATQAYEDARETVRAFIGAHDHKEIIFTRGTTEAINLVAYSYLTPRLQPGDEVLISAMEHHANIVPWQVACEQTGAVLKVIPMNEAGVLDLNAYEKLLTPRTKLVAVTHISNVLGTINPVKIMIEKAHAKNIPVLVDGAQAIVHTAVDVTALDCDFYVFSSHKLYGPTGVGVLFGKQKHLESMRPYQTGGDMIRRVTFEKTEYGDLPNKLEAGTPAIAEAIGLAAAIRYVENIGFKTIVEHQEELLNYATQQLQSRSDIKIFGNAPDKTSILSFEMEGVHPHDVATILDEHNVGIRAGHHCAMPVMDYYGVPAMARASFGIYNTLEDVDVLMKGLSAVREIFK